MSGVSSRPPVAPPQLPGLSIVRHLGSGGFADVFLYRDDLLARPVAVKVLGLNRLDARAQQAFLNEANLMARLSNHPAIVSVHQAGIASDGRPYLVMEYCSGPSLDERLRKGRFSEAETMRLGIQIAGAVETVHRAGILHRDIKPANILITEFGRPALTDFGIAASASISAHDGLSIPWAPAEVLAGGPGDVRSDVYSLAATLYTLLAGRSPFVVPGASNTTADLSQRIEAGALPPLGRPDVSAELEAVLATAMARHAGQRFGSVLAFARALQRVQIGQGFQPTAVDVVEKSAATESLADLGYTQIRGPGDSIGSAEVHHGAVTATTSSLPPPPPPPTVPDTTATMLRSPSTSLPRSPLAADARRPRAKWVQVAVAAGLSLAIGGAAVALALSWLSGRTVTDVAAGAAGAASATAKAAATSAASRAAAASADASDQPTSGEAPSASTPDAGSPSADATKPAEETAATPAFSCWDETMVSGLSRCRAPSAKSATYRYLRYVFPSIDSSSACTKADSSSKRDYTGFTVMWDCDLDSALLRYRFWQKAADGTEHYSEKFEGNTLATYDVSLSGSEETVPGWAKESNEPYQNTTTGTNRYVLTVWIPKYGLSVTAEGDTREAMHQALEAARMVPVANLLGWSEENPPKSLGFVLSQR